MTRQKNHVIYGLNNGQAVVAQLKYQVSYPNDQRVITPSLVYPMGKTALNISDNGVALIAIALHFGEKFIEEAFPSHTVAQHELILRGHKQELVDQ